MSGHAWQVKTRDQAKAFAEWIIEQQDAGKEITYTIKDSEMSPKQNSALHATFRRLAAALNEAGYDMKSEEVTKREIPWTEVSIKEVLFRPIITHMFGAKSTADVTKEELDHAVETLFREIAKRTGVSVPFTNKDIDSF